MERSTGAGSGSRERGAAIGKLLITVVWSLLTLLVLLIATELVLQIFHSAKQERRLEARAPMPIFRAARSGCGAFSVQHIHPQYMFFFPFDGAQRVAQSRPGCNIDADGFRGPGPAFAGKRKLAFILGGSSVFGQGTSDEATIAGALNALQSEVHFVNAGVQSWNSTQEMFRIAYQIVEYDPALVVVLDGANDIQIPIVYQRHGLDYPPGTPENFDALDRLVGDIEADYVDVPTEPLTERFFPRLSRTFRKLFRTSEDDDRGPLSDSKIAAAAAKYRMNLEVMHRLVTGGGGRFLSVFQPVACLHENVRGANVTCSDEAAYRKFHARVFAREVPYERVDFSNLFDALYADVPTFDPDGDVDITDEAIFFDAVHLWDRGDRLVAQGLAEHLGLAD